MAVFVLVCGMYTCVHHLSFIIACFIASTKGSNTVFLWYIGQSIGSVKK